MSAESQMVSILSHAISNANNLTGSAQSLVNQAVAAISEPVKIPQIPTLIKARGLTNFDELKFAPLQTTTNKPGLPHFPDITFPSPPSLMAVSEIDVEFEATLAELNFPTFHYASYGNAPQFSAANPSLNTSTALPASPDTALPSTPALLNFTELPQVQISVMPTEFVPLKVTLDFNSDFFNQQLAQFSGSIFNGDQGIRGLNELLEELSALSNQAFGSLFTDFIDLIGQQLTDRYQSRLVSTETKIQQGMDAALHEEATRVRAAFQDRSGWDLPALVQNALTATMEQSISAWTAQAQSQQTTNQWEQAQDLFELSATLYEKLRRVIQELKTKEIEMVLEAHRQSIRYAQQVTDALLTAFSVENYQKYDLEFKKAEFQLKLFEEELKVQLIQYEVVLAQLEAEKAKQEQDGLLVQQYQSELQRLESENQILATQVAMGRAELELKALPVELFEAQIRAFGSRVNAYEAQVSALVAEISGNTALIEAETAKIKAFEAQADGFIAEVNASRAIIQSQKQRNDAVLEELKAKVKAAMAPVEVSMAEAKYQLAAYETDARDYLVDAKAALETAKLEDEWRQQEQKGLFDAYQITREQAINLANKKLQILKAIAEVNEQGAGIMAQMAGGAMSAANGIANVIFDES
jgi:hypothetical protein